MKQYKVIGNTAIEHHFEIGTIVKHDHTYSDGVIRVIGEIKAEVGGGEHPQNVHPNDLEEIVDMPQLTERQAFVLTCWTGILLMEFERFWKMANVCLGETIINHEFADDEVWERLKEKTIDEFKAVTGSDDIAEVSE